MKLLYANHLSAMAMATSSFVSSANANAQDNTQDGYCPAGARDTLCSSGGTAVYNNNINIVDAATTLQDCFQYASGNGYKSFQVVYGQSYTTCTTPHTEWWSSIVDGDGECRNDDVGTYGWQPYLSTDKSSHLQEYVIQDLTSWPDGYSCYENGGLKKYTPAPTPAPTSSPTLPATPPATTGCPDGEVKCAMWGFEICTPVCCDMQTHQPCFDDNYNILSCAPWVRCSMQLSSGEKICFPASCPAPALAMKSKQGDDFSAKKHGLDKSMVRKEKAVFLRATKGSFEN